MIDKVNLIGAILAQIIYIVMILIFILRLLDKPKFEYGLGLVLMLSAFPLAYLLVTAPSLERPLIYYIQICLMLVFLIIELLLDYILKVDFRGVRWIVIIYVTIFFAGTGGMIGVASHAGRGWTLAAVLLFLVMAVLSFIQRAITGL